MLRDAPFVKDEIYHIYARGVEKREVFLSDFARKRFQAALFLLNDADTRGVNVSQMIALFSKSDGTVVWKNLYDKYERGDQFVDILAYALMPNHFHLLVRERQPEGGGVSKFMQKIMTGHTGYFNKVNERKGALFEGTFKSKHVAEERYFRWLFSYIHLNPVKLVDPTWKTDALNIGRTRDFLNTYEYSSYLDYVGRGRPEGKIITMDRLPEYLTPVSDLEGLLSLRAANGDQSFLG